MPKSVKLGGMNVLASAPVSWPNVPGISPVIQEYEMTLDEANAIVQRNAPVSLEITMEDGRVQKIDQLWALSLAPQKNPYIARVRVADRRWFWCYGHTIRRINMRRRVGYNRITAWDVVELQRVEDDVQYAPYSIKNGNPYTAKEIAEIFLQQVLIPEQKKTGRGVPYLIDEKLGTELLASSKLEEIDIDDRADTALLRALREIPAAEVSIRSDGTVLLYSKSNKLEAPQIESLVHNKVITDGDWIRPITYYNEAPSEIEIWVTLEPELRFDFIKESSTSTTPTSDDDLRMDNVVPNPDYSITIDGVEYPLNTYLLFDEWLDALVGDDTRYGAAPEVTDELIRRSMIPFLDLWSAFADVSSMDPTADWAARLGAIQQHWRKTFRIRQSWLDVILSMREYTVGTVNQATGARAPALVFADYFAMGSSKTFAKTYQDTGSFGRMTFGHNVKGWATIIDETAKPIPAEPKVDDEEQGIIRVAYKLDPYKMTEMILPGTIDNDQLPGWCGARGGRTQNITFDILRDESSEEPRLEEEYKLSVVLTCIPAAPNDDRQFYKITVKPSDVRSHEHAYAVAARAHGPKKIVRLPATIETARVRWKDSEAETIKSIFGKGTITDPAQLQAKLAPLIVNMDGTTVGPGGANQGASLNNIARAIATRVWSSFTTHPAGSVTGHLDVKHVPLGWIGQVTHTISPDGAATSTITVPPRYPELDWTAILDSATRAVVMRQVHPK